ncbi:MAG TPA: hypothetical protein ENI85_04675 [Deltaproteobacteria bacterium]|nr:hypothetical protein [Deltaproteobacteria bacterium]
MPGVVVRVPLWVMTRSMLVASILMLVSSAAAHAQVGLLPDEIERVDVIAIERDGRDLFAFDALSGRRSAIRLEVDEEVFFERSRGRIGLVLTNRRALAVAPGVGWQELRYRLNEGAPKVGLVDDRVALAVTGRRALGFLGRGIWVETRFSPQESAEALRVGSAAAVVATNRRALGLAPDLGRFVPTALQIREELESIRAEDTIVTLRTNRRILVFSAPRGIWTEQIRRIH